jgi:hypothetical protein
MERPPLVAVAKTISESGKIAIGKILLSKQGHPPISV